MTSINKGERSSFNFYRVLRSIWLNQDISQVELGQEHSLDKATVSNIISYLSQKNIIKVVKKQQIGNKPGRRPVGLAINNNFGYIIGIEILNKGLKIVAVDMHNNKIVENYQNISITYGNMDILLSEGIEKFKKNSELEDKTCVSIGFGFPGIIDHGNGIAHRSFEFGDPKIEYDFKEKIFSKFTVPCFIDNDANCCTWGILTEHRSKSYKNFMFVYLNFRTWTDKKKTLSNMGVGLGIAINGTLYFGDSNSAGEFNSIRRKSINSGQFSIDFEEMARLKTDEKIQQRFALELAEQVSQYVTTMNFGQLFLGGDVDYLPFDMKEILSKELNKNWPYDEPVQCKVKIISKQENLVASGAAGMCLERLFAIPENPEGIQISAASWDLLI